jgi:hypothetical protein
MTVPLSTNANGTQLLPRVRCGAEAQTSSNNVRASPSPTVCWFMPRRATTKVKSVRERKSLDPARDLEEGIGGPRRGVPAGPRRVREGFPHCGDPSRTLRGPAGPGRGPPNPSSVSEENAPALRWTLPKTAGRDPPGGCCIQGVFAVACGCRERTHHNLDCDRWLPCSAPQNWRLRHAIIWPVLPGVETYNSECGHKELAAQPVQIRTPKARHQPTASPNNASDRGFSIMLLLYNGRSSAGPVSTMVPPMCCPRPELLVKSLFVDQN